MVTIHVEPFGYTNDPLLGLLNYYIQNWFSRIAVPFFFIASGFFLYRKTPLSDFSLSPTKAYVIKLLRLYVIWTLIYFPLSNKKIISCEKDVIHGILVYCRNIIFEGSFWHLWYFPALIFSVVLISFLLSKKVSLKKILGAALFFYALGLLAQSWYGIIRPLSTAAPKLWAFLTLFMKVIGTTRDGLFEGFLFVGMGAYIAFCGFNIPQKKALLGFAVSYFLMLVEAAGVKYFDFVRGQDMYIFLVPSAYFAFGFVVNFRIPGNGGVYKTLRVLSSLIFYTHLWALWFVKYFIGRKTCMPFLLTLAISIGLSYVIYKLSDCPHFKWLKKLYS